MQTDPELWKRVLELLEEKLQMGLLQQARAVKEARVEGNDLILTTSTPEAREFFSAHVNQQRLIILARPIASFERVIVEG
jgi:hypothetical protein